MTPIPARVSRSSRQESRARRVARGALWLLGLVAVVCAPGDRASAGHELPFYPGYYPQEIRLETVAPATAGPLLAKSALHAYVGDDPFAGRKVPANVGSADSLGGYVVVTLNAKSSALASTERRCEAGTRILAALTPASGAWVPSPYPVTPFHADYLQHFDLVEKR